MKITADRELKALELAASKIRYLTNGMPVDAYNESNYISFVQDIPFNPTGYVLTFEIHNNLVQRVKLTNSLKLTYSVILNPLSIDKFNIQVTPKSPYARPLNQNVKIRTTQITSKFALPNNSTKC